MPSRVSTSQIFSHSQQNVSEARSKEALTGQKASSLKEITKPSDDPLGWATAKNLKDDIFVRETVSKNAQYATHELAVAESAISQIQDLLERGHELAISASNFHTVQSEGAYQSVFQDLKGVYQGVLQALNSRFNQKYIFSGYKTDTKPFDSGGKYSGDQGEFSIEIDRGLIKPINIDPQKAILGEGSSQGINIPDIFLRLIDGVERRDEDIVRSTLEDFKKGIEQLNVARVEIGSRMSQILKSVDSNQETSIHKKDVVAQKEEVDAIKVFSDLSRDQAVLNSALSTTQRVMENASPDILFK